MRGKGREGDTGKKEEEERREEDVEGVREGGNEIDKGGSGA